MAEVKHFCTRARVIAKVTDGQCAKPIERLPECNFCNAWQNVRIGSRTTININKEDIEVVQYGPELDSKSIPVFQY